MGVYPRMYGETLLSCLDALAKGGLSPHVRGNLRDRMEGNVRVGSIPACTGKPSPTCGSASWRRVYPRMYGETSRSSSVGSCPSGLSPHVRGNRGRR